MQPKLNRPALQPRRPALVRPNGPVWLKPLRFVLATFLLLILVEMLFVDGATTSPAGNGLGQVAANTRPPRLNDSLGLALPNNKVEAQEFSRRYASSYNFDQLNFLRREYAAGRGLPDVVVSAPNSGPNIAETPRPTSTAGGLLSSNAALTPQPTNVGIASSAGKPVINVFTPAAGCGTAPGADPYEPDDISAAAKSISIGVRQTHTFPTVTNLADPLPPNGDVDWIRFQITDISKRYTIETLNFVPTNIDTIIELWQGDITGATTFLSINDDVSSTDPRSQIIYTPASGDDAASIFFYVRIYGAPNRSCIGSYDVLVSTTVPPTVTATATAIPTTPDTCKDSYEYDDVPSKAKELRVSYGATPPFGGTPGVPEAPVPNNQIQIHYICGAGDQDWVYVDLVKGKPYSIFTAALSGGLDTIMILFEMDDKGNLNPLYSNDDFPGMGLASRIDFQVPTTPTTQNGEYKRYYVIIKDVTGKGTALLQYSLVMTSPGSNQADCIDSYEPDGLQYLSKEILVNEIQTRVICPNGDADWVKFFAKAGRSYTIKTSFGPVPGMDTYMSVFSILFDKNDPTQVVSQNLLGFSEDASPADLSSLVTFSVPVDGYYYAQIKNNGDIGRTGFYYQLTFNVTGAAVTTPDVPATQTAAAVNRTATAAAIRTSTASSGTRTATSTSSSAVSLLSLNFADPAFQKLWYYSDLAISQNQTQRSWEWGPKPGVTIREPYADSPGGIRQVQYFDKSRMEINNPKGDRSSQWFVSNGLLVKEMITGQVAMGDAITEKRTPANLQIAGDLNEQNKSPTYARFASLITVADNNRAPDLTGQVIKQGLAADGSVWTLGSPPENLKYGVHIKETGHNIPLVFYDFMNTSGSVYENGYKQGPLRNWLFAMGYPLSEPYWIKARVGGVERDILVQVFERRVLTYTPGNPPEWRVEMANVGGHYYLWRYNKNLYNE